MTVRPPGHHATIRLKPGVARAAGAGCSGSVRVVPIVLVSPLSSS
jgi:hypothetical protein